MNVEKEVKKLEGEIKRLAKGSRGKRGRQINPNSKHNYFVLARYLLERGERLRTVRIYLFHLNKFDAEISPDTLRNFAQYIIRKDKSDPDAIVRQNYFVYVVLKHYLNAISKSNWIDYLPDEKEIRKPYSESQDKSMTKEEFERLVDAVESENYRMIAKVLYHSGLRISECLLMRLEWIDFYKRPIEIMIPIQVSKSRKAGIAYIPNSVAEELKDYIEKKFQIKNINEFLADKKNGKRYLFTLSKESAKVKILKVLNDEINLVRLKLREAARKANIVRLNLISPHFMRYSFCHNLEKADFKPSEIQALMRHSSLETTQRYLKIRQEEIGKKFDEKFNG